MERKESAQSVKNPNRWRIVLTVVCLGILVYGFFHANSKMEDTAYLIGYSLFPSLGIWGIYYVTVAKRQGLRIGGFSFLAIYICMIGGGSIGSCQQKQDAGQMVCGMAGLSADSQSALGCMENSTDTSSMAQGKSGEVQRFLTGFINKMSSQRNEYLLELEAIGWDSILDAKRISLDKDFAESKGMIKKAQEMVGKYEGIYNEIFINARNDIQSLKLTDTEKKEMLAGFDDGFEENNDKVIQLLSLERKTISEFEKIINLSFA